MITQNKAVATSRLQTSTDWYGHPITEPDRSNPTRSRYESPLQTIMSFEYAISKEERMPYAWFFNSIDENYIGDFLTSRFSAVNPRYSYAQPSVRTSATNSAFATQTSLPQQKGRQNSRDNAPPRKEVPPVRDSYTRGGNESTPESSSISSSHNYNTYSNNNGNGYSEQLYQPRGRPSQGPQINPDDSPPLTPTQPQQALAPQLPSLPFAQSNSQHQSSALPSPEPESVGKSRVPRKPVMNSFVTRPATPPTESDKSEKRKSKLGKWKRLSALMKK